MIEPEVTTHAPRGLVISNSAHIPKHREAAGKHVDQFFSVCGRLPIFAHGNVRKVAPKLLLKFHANALLLVDAGSAKPRGAQGFNAWAVRPSVPAGAAIGADRGIAE